MWLDTEKNEIINSFEFLGEYGFIIEFLSFEKDSSEYIKMNTMVALIHNKKDYFVIKILRNYPFEPKMFYKLESIDELPKIHSYQSDKEIPVYNMDKDLWEKNKKKVKLGWFSTCTVYDVYKVVSSSIKRQIEQTSSFYGISVDNMN